MIKKTAIATAVVLGLMFLVFSTKVGSYVRTAARHAGTSANNMVPLEFEIERLKDQVIRLIPNMKENYRVVATEKVAVDNLRAEIITVRENLDRQKASLLQLSRDLESGVSVIVVGGREQKADEVAKKLERELQSYKRGENGLKAKEQMLEAKQKSLDAAREQLAAMREQKQELEVQIAQLEADVKTVRLAQTRCKFQLDDSQLSDVKRSLADLRNRLNIEKTAAELEGQDVNDPTPATTVKTRTNREIAREVQDQLQGPKVVQDDK